MYFKSFVSSLYRKLKLAPQKISIIYEQSISIFLTRFFYFPFLVFEKIFIRKNFYFLTNLSEGVGHSIMELHMFDRQFRNNQLKLRKNCKIILIYKKSEIVDNIINYYKSDLSYIRYIKSNFLFYLLLPIFIKSNNDLIIDIGVGEQTYKINSVKSDETKTQNIIFSGLGNRAVNEWTQVLENNLNKHKSKKFYQSFLNNISLTSKDWAQFSKIGIKNKKTLLIHVNNRIINACAKPLKPQAYIKLIEYAINKDYQIVFIGREKYPEIFKKYQVINYAESKIANFLNDLKLFKFAEFSIICASGLATIPRYLYKYYLYINYWHINTRIESDRCIMVPALISMKNNPLINIYHQIKLQNSETNFKNLNIESIESPNDLDILNAFEELESLKFGKYKFIKEQDILKDKLRNTQSRISQSFIKRKKIIFN